MPQPAGTANVLAQMTAFRKLKDEYNTEVAECLTVKSLQRNNVDASILDVKGWEKINNAALQGRLDIPKETTLAEEKASVAAGIMLNQFSTRVPVLNTFDNDQDEVIGDDEDELDDSPDESELLSLDDLYGYDDPEDNAEAALDDVLKIQENS